MMDHIINEAGEYTGRITVIPPRRQYFRFTYTGGVVLLVRINAENFKSGGRVPIAGLDNDSLNDTFIHLPYSKTKQWNPETQFDFD